MTENSQIWKVPDYLQLLWHSWSDAGSEEFVVFNTFSGETHCVNFTAALVLQYLEGRAASADVLTAEIWKAVPDDVSVKALDHIAELLAEFDQVGLVTAVPS
jgi:PqqD family protein of HPr-rel-A system